MSKLPESIELSPRDEAERLWHGAEKAFERSEEHLVELCEALDLGIRAVEVLAVVELQPVRGSFPATISMLLETPDPRVDPTRDAIAVPKALNFLHVVDMLSESSLDCVSRKLHHGWEDRRRSCQRARELTRETLGLTLDGRARQALLLLEAYRNRIFRVPPPVCIRPAEIRAAFPELARLYGALARLRAASAA